MIQYKDSNYLISKYGYVQNKKTGRVLKARDREGYGRVVMYIEGIKVERLIHRLVAEFYIPNHNNYQCVNHINNNRMDNNVENLEWCTQKMNMEHCVKQNRQCKGSDKHCSKLTIDQVIEIKRLCRTKELKQCRIAEMFNVRYQTIQSIQKKLTWKHTEEVDKGV